MPGDELIPALLRLALKAWRFFILLLEKQPDTKIQYFFGVCNLQRRGHNINVFRLCILQIYGIKKLRKYASSSKIIFIADFSENSAIYGAVLR